MTGTLNKMQLLAVTVALASFAALCAGQLDPCSPASYNELNEPHRSTGYHTGFPETPLCDIHLRRGWYRFTSDAGGEMPTVCPTRMKCGTIVPMWMRGTHPSVADGSVMREACGNFNHANSADPCCEHKVDIAVKNCTGFYVYYLSPTPSCPVSYCAGNRSPCPMGQWSQTGFSPCGQAHPMMKTPPTISGPHIHNNKSFDFTCDVHYPGQDTDQRFEVVWTFEGNEDPAIPPAVLQDPDRTASLEGSLLRGHLNSNIGCKVRVFYNWNQAHKGPFLTSNTYYAGIKVNPAKIVVNERSFEETVTITSTIPVMCDHGFECCVLFKLDTDAVQDISVQSMCDYKLCDTDWDPLTNTASMEVAMIANQDMIRDGDKQLLMTFEDLLPAGGGAYHRVFEGHKPDQIQIEVKDEETSFCWMITDPHFYGFDGRRHSLLKTGDFVAMEIQSRDFQVMVRNWACSRYAACICGVVIREKNDVIRIDQCDQMNRGSYTSPTVQVDYLLSEGVIVQRSNAGSIIGVYLASGAEIRVETNSQFFKVYITIPGTYKNLAAGLCGTNDGITDNEFMLPGGTHCDRFDTRCIIDRFQEAWKSSPLDQDNLFENVPALVTTTAEVKYCACKDNHNGAPAINCTIRTDKPTTRNACRNCPVITSHLAPIPRVGLNRRKRAVVFEDLDEPDTPYVQENVPPMDPNKQWPNAQGMTQAQAETLCTRAINRSQLAAKCQATDPTIRESLMEDCLSDILHSGGTDFVDAITDAFTFTCQMTLAKDPANYVTSPTGERIMKPEYLDDICSTNCLQHGICGSGGVCVCQMGWGGAECHIESGKGPQMGNIRGGPLCDLTKRPCQRVFVDVTNIDLSDDLSCKIQAVDDQGKPVGRAVITEAGFLSSTRISCVIPRTTISSRHYQVSATNDGTLFGNSLDLHVFDSTCLDCTGTGCTEKTTACHINSVCHHNGEVDSTDTSRQCDVAVNTSDWTVIQTTPRPNLTFFPTLSGPDANSMMKCRFYPKGDVTGAVTVTWLVDGSVIKSEMLNFGLTTGMISTAELPTSGKLTCEVGIGNAASESGSINLAYIRH